MSNIPVNHLGNYAATGVNSASISQIDKFKDGLNDEIRSQKANASVQFLQRLLDEHPEFSKAERAAVEEMLRDAQKDLAQLQQELNKKYNVQ